MLSKPFGKRKILIFNHKYLDNQTGDRLVKIKGFLTDLKVYNYHCSVNEIKDFINGSKTKSLDPFKLIRLCQLGLAPAHISFLRRYPSILQLLPLSPWIHPVSSNSQSQPTVSRSTMNIQSHVIRSTVDS